MLMYGKERIYKKVEIIGVSSQGIEGAIETALRKAQNTLDKISWFEVQDIRGHVGENGKVAEYQVVIKVSFELKE
jgi:flavin-binding protein dodecin